MIQLKTFIALRALNHPSLECLTCSFNHRKSRSEKSLNVHNILALTVQYFLGITSSFIQVTYKIVNPSKQNIGRSKI